MHKHWTSVVPLKFHWTGKCIDKEVWRDCWPNSNFCPKMFFSSLQSFVKWLRVVKKGLGLLAAMWLVKKHLALGEKLFIRKIHLSVSVGNQSNFIPASSHSAIKLFHSQQAAWRRDPGALFDKFRKEGVLGSANHCWQKEINKKHVHTCFLWLFVLFRKLRKSFL